MFKTNEPIIGPYTKSDLKDRDIITLTFPLNQNTLNNLKHLKTNTTIMLQASNKEIYDEELYYKNVIDFFHHISQLNKNITIQIKVYNRELLKKSGLLNNIPKNVLLRIENDEYTYSLHEYYQEERKLDEMIKPIKQANLSPLEKYLAIYDLVKNYKPYKDNEENPDEARNIRYILNDDNHYIVCAGFTKLLTELLNRVGISSKYLSVVIDEPYDENLTAEEKKSKNNRHARNLIKIDDDKYNIHGYYLADSTWDSNKKGHNLYLNSIMTFDRKKEAKSLEKLDDIDLLLDFHNLDDFKEKIQYFIKKSISYPHIDAPKEEARRKNAYKDLYLKIIDILKIMDYDKYKEIYIKYNDYININLDSTTSNKLETIIANLLIDYAKYIIPLSNKEVTLETILRAMINVKRNVYFMTDSKIKEWLEKTINDNQKIEEIAFPYIYDPNKKIEAYLESREDNYHKK